MTKSNYLQELEKQKNALMEYCKWNIEAENRLNALYDLAKEGYLKGQEDIKEEITKNQIARLFTIRVAKHFCESVEMDKEDFFKYMQKANNEMKEYIKKEMTKSNYLQELEDKEKLK
jgi:hypothetical protein